MVQQAKNIERFGVASPTRHQRRTLCKRDGDAVVNESDSDMQSNKEKSARSEQSTAKELCPSKPKQRKATASKTCRSTALAQIDNLKFKDFIGTDEDSSDAYSPNLRRLSKDALIDKINVLQDEVKRLKKDNERLRVLRCVNEDFGKLRELCSSIIQDFQNLQRDSRHGQSKSDMSSSTVMEPATLQEDITSKPATQSQPHDKNSSAVMRAGETGSRQENNQPHTAESGSTTRATHLEIQPHDKNTLVIVTNDAGELEGTSLVEKESSNPEVVAQPLPSSSQETGSQNRTTPKDKVDFGSRLIDKHVVSRLDKRKGLSNFTSALMGAVFASDKMATSTMIGTVSNFQKKHRAGHKKKELDPSMRDAVMDFIRNDAEGSHSKMIKSAMKAKLNNEAATLKRKLLAQQFNEMAAAGQQHQNPLPPTAPAPDPPAATATPASTPAAPPATGDVA